MPSIHVQSLTPRMRRLVATDRYTRAAVEPLTPDELALLTTAASSDEQRNVPLPPHRALGMLALAARPEVAIPVLDQVARNPAAPRTNRIAALRGLGRIATPEAQALLLAQAGDSDPRVQQAALAALGLFADRQALTALERQVRPQDDAARRQLELTRALIAHRTGLAGPFVDERRPLSREPIAAARMSAVTLTMKTAAETAADLARLTGPTYGIRLAERAYALTCGRADWTIFGNAELGASIGVSPRLFERPWILALAARWQPPGIAAAVQYVVLSRPAGTGVRLDVVRADGEVVYTGTATASGTALSFSVADVERPATAPTTLSGVLDTNSARLDVAIVYERRVGTRRTQTTRA